VKDKVSVAGINFEDKAQNIISSTSQEDLDLTDGIKINGPDFWVQLRKSNTEPIVRIFAEAKTIEKASELVKKYREMIN
jgi:phosphomannomutase